MKGLKFLYVYRATFPNKKAFSIQVMNTCWAIANRGHEVVLWIDRLTGTFKDLFDYYGLKPLSNLSVIECHVRGDCLKSRWSFWKTSKRIRPLLKRFPPEEGWIFYLRQPYMLLLLRKILGQGVPIFYEVHWISSLVYRERGKEKNILDEGLEGEALKEATGVVFNSQGTRELVEGKWGEREDGVVIPNGTWVRRAQGVRDLSLIYSGQLYPWKGVGYCLELIRDSSLPILHILGGNRLTELEEIRSLAKEKGITDKVVLHGFQIPARVPSFLLRAQVGLVPFSPHYTETRFMTSPIKLYEYMGHGVVPMVMDLPSLGWVKDLLGEEVILKGDPGVDRKKVEYLIRDESFQEKLREEGYRIAQDFTWDKRAQRIEAYVERVLE